MQFLEPKGMVHDKKKTDSETLRHESGSQGDNAMNTFGMFSVSPTLNDYQNWLPRMTPWEGVIEDQ